jgi:two-component system sensor histidine kinase RegB
MTVLVEEMLSDTSLHALAREDCSLLQEQLLQCKATLAELTRTAELTTARQRQSSSLGEFVERCVGRWAVRRPGVICEVSCADTGDGAPGPRIEFDSTLCQAFDNLLNNAADSGSDRVAVSYRWSDREAEIAVRDWGEGFAPELLQDIGKPIIRTSGSGLGIGLLLSHATVERYGGRIELCNRRDGGAKATLYLPLAAVQQGESGS